MANNTPNISQDKIIIKGAREHNLKNIDVEIPRNKLTVITGLSGSGKSTLAFDTLYAEGQRRYVESLSAYARQFLGLMNKPDVDAIEGLSPAISIEQKTTSKNPRSTVGTVTEIHDYLRLLFARIGHPHCPECGDKIKPQSIEEMVSKITNLPKGTNIQILAPIIQKKKGTYSTLVESLSKKGYTKVRIDGTIQSTDEPFELDKQIKHNIEIIIDRIQVSKEEISRITQALELSIKESNGLVIILHDNQEMLLSKNFACPKCGINLPEFSPRMFSFNSPFGACPDCQGLGIRMDFDPNLVIPNKKLSIEEGAIAPWSRQFKSFYMQKLISLCRHYNIPSDISVEKLDEKMLNIILYGSKGEKIKTTYTHKYNEGMWETHTEFEGIINNLRRLQSETTSEKRKEDFQKYMHSDLCTTCNGDRLKQEVMAVTINKLSIIDVSKLSIAEAKIFFEKIVLSKQEQLIANLILKEINSRLKFLSDVGLDYLTLLRSSGTLSGGEAQRIRLATQIGANLMGVMYVLDEPSIGLHQKDNNKLIDTLKHLRDIGNTVIVVEHDEDTMREADYIIDLGPKAGIHGGRVVAQGTFEDIKASKKSLTGMYLSGKKTIPVPKERRIWTDYLELLNARENNLKNINVRIPLKIITCVTGVSGSGKSTLINETLYKALMQNLYGSRIPAGAHYKLKYLNKIDKVINIDQSPIGRTPRSNPATYTKIFTDIRDIFSETKEAKQKGFGPSRFSFNVPDGRCDACDGDGMIKIEMHFLPDIYVPCEVCDGKRYSKETLSIKYKDKTISDVLDMTVEEAYEFFKSIPRIKNKLETLNDVGLGYIKLGQSSTTLSGGEAQRIKLTSELAKRATGRTVYLLDEPTTGLHFDDVNKLIGVLNRLTDAGNTIIVIEHNLDIIKSADWIIDLGPAGGDAGGQIIAEGTPEQVAKSSKSYTGQFLKKALEKK